MWVFEEEIDGRKLTEIINTDHENVKYLPGRKIPENVRAVPDLAEAAKDADLLIFVLPHQFLPRLLPVIKGVMSPGAEAISLIKGMDFDESGPVLVSRTISAGLGVRCAVLMGANIANEVADGHMCEATVGHADGADAGSWVLLFDTPTFRITPTLDALGVEACGALKNVVALGAGFVDGLGYGTNTKAAIMRLGLLEMRKFIAMYLGDEHTQLETMFESSGVADLITTCFSGRNVRVAKAFAEGKGSWGDLEAEMLGGQKLQGTLTCKEVHAILHRTGKADQFPLFEAIYKISFEGVPPAELVTMQLHEPKWVSCPDGRCPDVGQ